MYISEEAKHKIHHLIGMVIITFGIFGIFFSVQAYPKIFQIGAQIEDLKDIDPKQPVKIKFSEPMLASQAEKSIIIIPETEADFSWQNNNKILIISPANFWKPDQNYRISIKGGKSIMLTEISANLSFKTIPYPSVADFYPASGEKDVLLDIEDPITASFNESINNFRVKFIIRPFHDLAYQVSPDGKQVKLLSKNELGRGQKYEVEAWICHKEESEDSYKKIYATYFETKPLPPANWEKDFNLRLEQAKKFTDPRIISGKYIDLNVKSQVMAIFENGKLLDAYLISSGKPGMPTPQGIFHIANKFLRAWSKKYGLFMPFWMAVASDGSFGIHELPEWPGGYKEGQFHLGTPVSHGCVRLGVGPAERVYNWAEIGTPVIIHE